MDTPAAQTTMPTPDRLAKPTLPATPSQADTGAQVYWLSCLPCHGDRGQGLTEEFIQTYPEEDHNCWASGCHGANPYESGFTIPKDIPPIIGAGTLQKFSTAFVLQAYIQAAMPYWKPGSLSADEAWQVTAFLLRENQLWDARQNLTEENARAVFINTPAVSVTPGLSAAPGNFLPVPVIALFIGFILLGLFLLFRRSTPSGGNP